MEWGVVSFIAERRTPKMTLSVHFSGPRKEPLHSLISISKFHAEKPDVNIICQFLEVLCVRFKADYGVVHILTKEEFASRMRNVRKGRRRWYP